MLKVDKRWPQCFWPVVVTRWEYALLEGGSYHRRHPAVGRTCRKEKTQPTGPENLLLYLQRLPPSSHHFLPHMHPQPNSHQDQTYPRDNIDKYRIKSVVRAVWIWNLLLFPPPTLLNRSAVGIAARFGARSGHPMRHVHEPPSWSSGRTHSQGETSRTRFLSSHEYAW